MTMSTRLMRAGIACFAMSSAMLLGACSDRDSRNAQQNVDAAAEKTKDAAIAAGNKAADLAEKARDNTKAYLNSPEVKKDLDNAKNAVKNAVDGNSRSSDEAPKK